MTENNIFCNKKSTRKEDQTMYESPRAERLCLLTEKIMNLDLLFASAEGDETDNKTSIDDLLDGLL